MLLVDLKGSLKTLSQCGDLYDGVPEPNTSNALWNEENVDVQQENVPPKNKLQEALSQNANVSSVQSKHLENDVEVWSDFLYARFHPRTVNVINEYSHNSEENPFDVFHLGREIWKKSDLEDEYTDRLRCYAEECDYLQGFQILTDPINAFGGVTSSCLEYIKDEYDKKAVLSFPLIPSYYSDYDFKKSDDREKSTVKDSIRYVIYFLLFYKRLSTVLLFFRLVNLLLSLDALGENCCLTVPLCTGTKGWRQPGPKRNFRNLNYNQESLYHTSAIIATALETLTTPYRTKGNAFTIGDFCSDLNRNGRKIAAASLQLPFGIKSGEDLLQCLDEWQGPLFESLTPNYKIEEDKTVQHITLRGIPLYRLKKEERYAKAQKQMPAYRCQTVEEMLQFYFSSTCVYTASRVTTLNAGLNVGVPYPDIFSELVDINGDVGSTSRRDDGKVVFLQISIF